MKKTKHFIQQKAKVISVAGAYPRSGCTYMSISLAYFLTKKSYKVAVIEYNDSGHLAEMAKAYELPVSEDGCFTFHDCHFYIYDDDFMSVINSGYDYVVVDYGMIENVTKEMYYFGDFCILTATLSPWEISSFRNIVYQEENINRNRILFTILLSDQQPDMKKKLMKEFDITDQIFFVPYQRDMTDTDALKDMSSFLGIEQEITEKKIPFWKQFICKNHSSEIPEHDIPEHEQHYEKPAVMLVKEIQDEESETEETIQINIQENVQEECVKIQETITTPIQETENMEFQQENIMVPDTEDHAEHTEDPEISSFNTKMEEPTESVEEKNDQKTFDTPLFVEPIKKIQEEIVSYINDKQPNYKAKSEMCFIHKSFRVQDVQETYAKMFKIVAYPLEYHPQRPIRIMLCVFYNNEVFVLSSPEDKMSVTFSIDDEEILFNGQFKAGVFDVTALSLKDDREIKQIKTLKEQQFSGLPDEFPKYTGLHTNIKEHHLILYPLYTHNAPQGKCAFMYELTFPDHEKMYGSSEENFEALLPIAGKLHTVSCHWLRLGNEAHFTTQLVE